MMIKFVVAAVLAASWPQDGFGPGHTGYNPSESVINATTVAELKQRWTVRPAPGPLGCRPAPVAPVVQDERMFVLDGGGVAAHDVRTGKRLWRFRAGYFDGAGLSVVGKVVVGTEVNCFSQSDWSTNVVGLDARTGRELWNSSHSWSTESSVADAGVIVVSGVCGTCDDARFAVTAFRVSDGRRLWTRENMALAGPVAAKGRVLLRSTVKEETQVVAVRTGETSAGIGASWSVHAADPAGEHLFVRDTDGLAKVRISDLRTRWRVRGETGELATDGRRVYVASAGRVNAYHAGSGKLAWTRAMRTPDDPIRAGGLLYVRSERKLRVLSPATGRPVASGRSYGTVTDHVVVTGGRLFTLDATTVRAWTP